MGALQVGQHLGVDHGLEVKLHPELGEHFDFAQAFDQGQFVLGDAVGVQPSGQRARVQVGANAAAAQPLSGAGGSEAFPAPTRATARPLSGAGCEGQGSTTERS